jgi:hypothetical protein
MDTNLIVEARLLPVILPAILNPIYHINSAKAILRVKKKATDYTKFI